MTRVLAVVLAVVSAVLAASWPAVYGEKQVPATQYVPPLHFKRSPGLESDEAVLTERLTRALAQGHLASLRSQGCGGSLSASGSSATLTSPGYPYGYTNDLQCVWTITVAVETSCQIANVPVPFYDGCMGSQIGWANWRNWTCTFRLKFQAPAGQHVKLTVDNMEIENQANCAWDQLFVRVANEIVPAVLCGAGSISGSFISGDNEMMVIFVSDGSVTEKGFSATYSAVSLQ